MRIKDWRPIHRRRVPIEWVNKHWGLGGTPDWGEPLWPGYKKRVKFWDSKFPTIIIAIIGLSGLITIFLFALPALLVIFGYCPKYL